MDQDGDALDVKIPKYQFPRNIFASVERRITPNIIDTLHPTHVVSSVGAQETALIHATCKAQYALFCALILRLHY